MPLRKEANGEEQTAGPELRILTSRSLSGGGEGLFLRDLPRDLAPPLRHARSSSSLMGVDGLWTVSKSPERHRKSHHRWMSQSAKPTQLCWSVHKCACTPLDSVRSHCSVLTRSRLSASAPILLCLNQREKGARGGGEHAHTHTHTHTHTQTIVRNTVWGRVLGGGW